MRVTGRGVAVAASIGIAIMLGTGTSHAQTVPAEALVESLREGGYVLVMRHARSPREVPDRQTANADNVKRERQLDDAGRVGAAAMGKALRDLAIPIGSVLTSPAYRAVETVRHAQLARPQIHVELDDLAQSTQGAANAQAAWLREQATRIPASTNTIVVSHLQNIARAFPKWDPLAEGEVVVVGSDGKGGTRAAGRIKIEEWPRLAASRAADDIVDELRFRNGGRR